MNRKPASAALLSLALLAGCASPGDYPSLAIREAERVAGTFTPPELAPLPPPAPAVLSQLDELAAAAEAAHAAFLAKAPRAAAIVANARGTGAASEARARAEVALASLISARSQTMVPVADIDRLYVAAAVEGTALAPIEEVRTEVEAQVAVEDATIQRLRDVLAR